MAKYFSMAEIISAVVFRDVFLAVLPLDSMHVILWRTVEPSALKRTSKTAFMNVASGRKESAMTLLNSSMLLGIGFSRYP
jgi:hypothetical protein